MISCVLRTVAPTIGTAPKNPTEDDEGNDVTLECSFGAIVRPGVEHANRRLNETRK